jgi:hypothetical protein
MARRWLLHGGAAVRTFWEKQENLGMRQNSGNSAGILVRLQNFAIFHANSYTLSLKLTQRFPSEILPSGLRPKSDKFRQGVADNTRYGHGRASTRSFYAHHVAEMSTAVQVSDAIVLGNSAASTMFQATMRM